MTGFKPMWASPPGDTMLDIMHDLNMAISDFAIELKMSQKRTATY